MLLFESGSSLRAVSLLWSSIIYKNSADHGCITSRCTGALNTPPGFWDQLEPVVLPDFGTTRSGTGKVAAYPSKTAKITCQTKFQW